AGSSIEVPLRSIVSSEHLFLQLAKATNLLQEAIEIFGQHFYDHLTAQLSIRLFLGIRRRDISAFFVRKCGDLLHRIIKADDLQFDSRVTNQFAICHLWSRCFRWSLLSYFGGDPLGLTSLWLCCLRRCIL